MVMKRAKQAMKTHTQQLHLHLDFITEAHTVPKETDLVELTGNILGFKSATSKGIIKVQVGPFAEKSYVFVKIGKTRERNDMSCSMYACMRKLGMPNVNAYVVPVTWDDQRWQKHSSANVTDKTKTWGEKC